MELVTPQSPPLQQSLPNHDKFWQECLSTFWDIFHSDAAFGLPELCGGLLAFTRAPKVERPDKHKIKDPRIPL